eukprot:SAG22_NODE_2437_length_2575_cov_18.769790_2_plen_93_part_00
MAEPSSSGGSGGSKIVVHVRLKSSIPPSHRETIKKLVAGGTLKVDHPRLEPDTVAAVDPAVSSESLVGMHLQLQKQGESTAAPEIAQPANDE